MRTRFFRDRRAAGQSLAEMLSEYRGRSDAIVIAIPRGGVPVGYEVAKALDLPFDVFIVRKLGVPGHEELALGAVASGGGVVLNDSIVESLGISRATIEGVLEKEQLELRRREEIYRGNRPAIAFKDKVILLIDDGLATGASIMAACQAIQHHHPAKIIVASPIASSEACDAIEAILGSETCVCALTPDPLYSIGTWYQDFSQTNDDEVTELLELRRTEMLAKPNGGVS